MLGGSVELRLLALVAVLGGCARDNPAYGSGGADTGQSGGRTGGSTAGTTAAATTSASAGSTGSAGNPSGVTGDPDASGATAPGPTGEDTEGDTASSRTSSGGGSDCETIIVEVQSDTFVSNAPEGCGGGSCADWRFTGVGSYDIRSAGTFDSIMLLRFPAIDPVEVTAATLLLQVATEVPNAAGLFEIHVLETVSLWSDGSTSGLQKGQPTWNRAASGEAQWTDGAGDNVADFDELHDDWPTIPVAPGEGADGELDLPILARDLPELNARLAVSIPVQLGVTVLAQTQQGAITALTTDAGAVAQLRLVVGCE